MQNIDYSKAGNDKSTIREFSINNIYLDVYKILFKHVSHIDFIHLVLTCKYLKDKIYDNKSFWIYQLNEASNLSKINNSSNINIVTRQNPDQISGHINWSLILNENFTTKKALKYYTNAISYADENRHIIIQLNDKIDRLHKYRNYIKTDEDNLLNLKRTESVMSIAARSKSNENDLSKFEKLKTDIEYTNNRIKEHTSNLDAIVSELCEKSATPEDPLVPIAIPVIRVDVNSMEKYLIWTFRRKWIKYRMSLPPKEKLALIFNGRIVTKVDDSEKIVESMQIPLVKKLNYDANRDFIVSNFPRSIQKKICEGHDNKHDQQSKINNTTISNNNNEVVNDNGFLDDIDLSSSNSGSSKYLNTSINNNSHIYKNLDLNNFIKIQVRRYPSVVDLSTLYLKFECNQGKSVDYYSFDGIVQGTDNNADIVVSVPLLPVRNSKFIVIPIDRSSSMPINLTDVTKSIKFNSTMMNYCKHEFFVDKFNSIIDVAISIPIHSKKYDAIKSRKYRMAEDSRISHYNLMRQQNIFGSSKSETANSLEHENIKQLENKLLKCFPMINKSGIVSTPLNLLGGNIYEKEIKEFTLVHKEVTAIVITVNVDSLFEFYKPK